mmetsp:Transcript_18482/g.54617  ORF Transcript_18482/g.54617 Transcript_18482/m.54617 type:complete len:203 (+) Transcript_18482:3-611(+)
MPWPLAQARTWGSWTEPPACAMNLTPNLAATSMLSGKGKNASDANATPSSFFMSAARSDAPSSGGAFPDAKSLSKAAFSWGAYASKPPSRNATRALTRCWRLRPSAKGRSRTGGVWRNHHVATFFAASLTQSTRDCWPAPTPTTWPPTAKQMELDCVYLAVIDANTRSRCASPGMGPPETASTATSALVHSRALRAWAKPTP